MACSVPADHFPYQTARVAELLGRPVLALTRVTGGANSRVYRAETPDGPRAVKLYPAGGGDTRDRLGAETGAIAFLTRHGVDCVPPLVAVDRSQGMAAFGWIEGSPVGPAGPADTEAALGFLRTLDGLRDAQGAGAMPEASEACLSLGELTRQIRQRLARLLAVPDTPRDFLKEVDQILATIGDDTADGNLPPPLRTLSPSDFGFHNALRRPDGRLVFLDFEYFGWDDPVKLTADTLLHPGMMLTDAAKRRFADGALALYGARDPGFGGRLAQLMPLYALRWCMIVLNEFLPERWEHRVRAGEAADRPAVLDRQLTKARGLLTAARVLLPGGPA